MCCIVCFSSSHLFLYLLFCTNHVLTINHTIQRDIFYWLHIAAKAKIPEGDVWAKAGSTVTLNCLISESSSPPSYVFWYHEGTVINYSDHSSKSRGGGKVKIVTDKLTGTSRLEIIGIRAPDSGKYTCKASHADPTSVTLHVIPLHGELQ